MVGVVNCYEERQFGWRRAGEKKMPTHEGKRIFKDNGWWGLEMR